MRGHIVAIFEGGSLKWDVLQKLDRYWSINAPERSSSDVTSGSGVRTRSRTASSNGIADSCSVSGGTNVTVTTNASATSATSTTASSASSTTACSSGGGGGGGGGSVSGSGGVGAANLATVECTIAGGATIRHYHICNDKRHVLIKDSNQAVALYDVLLVRVWFLLCRSCYCWYLLVSSALCTFFSFFRRGK